MRYFRQRVWMPRWQAWLLWAAPVAHMLNVALEWLVGVLDA